MRRKPIRDWDENEPLPSRSPRQEEPTRPEAEQAEENSNVLPPRGRVHHSEKSKWTQWYYRVLLLLFVGLTAGLLVWGYRTFDS